MRLHFIHFLLAWWSGVCLTLNFSPGDIDHYKQKVKNMFYFAYDSYLEHAFPYDELKPITCSGMDTWGSFSLTLVDALDTLILMGNYTEFERAAELVLKNVDVDANVNVSVFETNIRVIGGLISAHMFSGLNRTGRLVEDGWPCSGPLLRLAERFADKLLVAFNTETGMPYGTVNLRYGVHRQETPITCTAGVGTFLIEMGTLSRLTGNPHYERIALRASNELWKQRSSIGLVGNHINVQTGQWTATDSGIGAGVDSYFEYLVKAGILLQRPELMLQFHGFVDAINEHVRHDDWFLWVTMAKGQVSLPIFQSLEAFWPGVLTLIGHIDDAQRIMLTYNQIIRQYGFVPEFYNIPNTDADGIPQPPKHPLDLFMFRNIRHPKRKKRNRDIRNVHKRSGYPLRPEMAESLMYLYRATKDPTWLQIGADMIEAIEFSCKTNCGYATVHNVKDHMIEDRMESFFLAETTKYLYLLFDTDNLIHNDGSRAQIVDTTNGKCTVFGGGYIFNTEAHPVDPAQLYCCSGERAHDRSILSDFAANIDFAQLFDLDSDIFDGFGGGKKAKEENNMEYTLPLGVIDLMKSQRDESDRKSRTRDRYRNDDDNETEVVEEDGFSIEYETSTGESGSVNVDAPPKPSVKESIDAESGTQPIQVKSSGPSNFVDASATSAKLPAAQITADQALVTHEFADAIVKLLERLNTDYNALLEVSEQLEYWERMNELNKDCEMCCHAEKKLRRYLRIVEQSVRRQRQKSAKLCRKSEAPFREQDLYSKEMPPKLGDDVDESLKMARRRTLEKICLHPSEIELGTYVEWQSSLMSCEARPFLSRFTGIGQVITVV